MGLLEPLLQDFELLRVEGALGPLEVYGAFLIGAGLILEGRGGRGQRDGGRVGKCRREAGRTVETGGKGEPGHGVVDHGVAREVARSALGRPVPYNSVDGGDAGGGARLANTLRDQPLAYLPGKYCGVLPLVGLNLVDDLWRGHLGLAAPNHAGHPTLLVGWHHLGPVGGVEGRIAGL